MILVKVSVPWEVWLMMDTSHAKLFGYNNFLIISAMKNGKRKGNKYSVNRTTSFRDVIFVF
jgi:hypothetical protein